MIISLILQAHWMVLKMPRRKTTEDDERRLAERIRNNHHRRISDRSSFDLAFSRELDVSDKSLSDNQKRLRSKVFKRYTSLSEVQKELRAGEFSKKDLFKQAGGKSLDRDRQKTAKVIVTDKDEYIKKGARNVDLKGYDTKAKRGHVFPAKIKGRVVYVHKTHIRFKNKIYVRYRDKRGRFASVKK